MTSSPEPKEPKACPSCKKPWGTCSCRADRLALFALDMNAKKDKDADR